MSKNVATLAAVFSILFVVIFTIAINIAYLYGGC